jgi:ribosomal-protein-alanine N-acetyltransferase
VDLKQLLSDIQCIKGKRVELKRISPEDAPGMRELVDSETVYKYLPTFLYEKQYDDMQYVIEHLYDECIRESIILGIYLDDEFCGIEEMYGFKDSIHKISVGYRLLEKYWGKGIATEALGLLVDFLYTKTDIEIITASTMIENVASANVLRKNGFDMVVSAVPEDWGFEEPTIADKWIR